MNSLPVGIESPPGFDRMRLFAEGAGLAFSGIYVDVRADRIFNRGTGNEEQLAAAYGLAASHLGVEPQDFVLSTGYPKLKDSRDLASDWDGPLVSVAVGPGHLSDPSRNPNGRALCTIYAGAGRDRWAMGSHPADATVLFGLTRSGITFSSLVPWQATRYGLVNKMFRKLDLVERDLTGQPLDPTNVMIVMGPGARVGLKIDNDKGYPFMESGGEIFVRNMPVVAPGRRDRKERLAERDLDLSRLVYDLLTTVTINGRRVPRDQVIFDPRCTMTDPNSHSKRVIDAQEGYGVFYTEPKASCFFGGAVARIQR